MTRPHRQAGQTMTEYILLIGLIAIACIVAVKMFGKDVKSGFESASEEVRSATKK